MKYIAVVGFIDDFKRFEGMILNNCNIRFINVSFPEHADGRVFDSYIELYNSSKLSGYDKIIHAVKSRIK